MAFKTNKKKTGSADARKNASFAGIGGHNCDSMSGGHPTAGCEGSGANVRHAKPKAKENVSPPNANSYASFSGVGGKCK